MMSWEQRHSAGSTKAHDSAVANTINNFVLILRTDYHRYLVLQNYLQSFIVRFLLWSIPLYGAGPVWC